MQGTITTYGYADFQCPGCFTLNIHGTSNLQSRGRVDLDDNWVPTPTNDTIYQNNTADAHDIASYIQQLLPLLARGNVTSLNILQNATQDQIVTYITTASPYARVMTNHWGGSTRLSNSCDSGVVGPNARVCGMDNVYIVDGGIIPIPFSVNPQYGIMIASERAADNVIGDRADCCACLGQATATCSGDTPAASLPSKTVSLTAITSSHSGGMGLTSEKIYAQFTLWVLMSILLASGLF
jgi:cellobiose dehydrogenase (acceptor)